MSLFAGLVVSHGATAAANPLVRSIAGLMERNGSQRIETYACDRIWIAKRDLGVFGSSGVYRGADGSITVVTGDPILNDPNPSSHRTRLADVTRLNQAFVCANESILREARGVFALVHANPGPSPVVLATDHLGIRPLYVYTSAEFIAFSSQLLLLRDLLGLGLCSRGSVEMAALGYPLGRRTPVQDILRLGAAEVLEIGPNLRSIFHRYWSWDTDIRENGGAPPSSVMRKDLDEAVYGEFKRSVQVRLGSDRTAVSYLSGGLDSRAIVALLRDKEVEVSSHNFSIPGQQDHLIGEAIARALGTDHTFAPRKLPVELWLGDWSFLLRQSLERSRPAIATPPRPRLVWSGDGGSVAVGGVYLDSTIAKTLERAGEHGAATLLAPGLPRKLLGPTSTKRMASYVHAGIVEELSGIGHPDSLRRLYLFFLLNDQRRHLDGHFEFLDEHEIEFHLPFFDSFFLKLLGSIPVSRIQKHAFYYDWLTLFPAETRSVPWQAYPSHLPCPLPPLSAAPDQWSDNQEAAAAGVFKRARRLRRGQAIRMLRSPAFPSSVVSRIRFITMMILDQSGIRDYDHPFRFVRRLHVFNGGAIERINIRE